MKKSVTMPDNEPNEAKFQIPSEGQHTFQVVDVNQDRNDADIMLVKLEVTDGDEAGRTILHRVSLNSEWKGFFLTRLFLKAVGENYKGSVDIDSDNWIGRGFVANIIHNTGKNGKTYANIDSFNFDVTAEIAVPKTPSDVKWEE